MIMLMFFFDVDDDVDYDDDDEDDDYDDDDDDVCFYRLVWLIMRDSMCGEWQFSLYLQHYRRQQNVPWWSVFSLLDFLIRYTHDILQYYTYMLFRLTSVNQIYLYLLIEYEKQIIEVVLFNRFCWHTMQIV